MRARRRLAVAGHLAVAASVAAGLSGCGGDARAVTPTRPGHIKPLDAPMPAQIGGLQVVREDIAQTVASAGPAYVDAVAMYSLKAGTVLTATLEVSRFNRGAEYRRPSFQAGIVGRIGSTTPARYRLGKDTVFFTTGARQNLAVWFRAQYLVILSVKQDYGDARALLRQALEVKL